MKADGNDAAFLSAGAPDLGNPKAVQAKTLNNWQAEGTIELLGHVDGLPTLLWTDDVVVLQSAYAEGVPRILLEAAPSILAIVTTDMLGCREIVEHVVNGLVVSTRDTKGLAGAVKVLLERSDSRARVGEAERQKVLSEFDEDKGMKRI